MGVCWSLVGWAGHRIVSDDGRMGRGGCRWLASNLSADETGGELVGTPKRELELFNLPILSFAPHSRSDVVRRKNPRTGCVSV